MGDAVRGFPPIAAPDARVLVLGSMPGVASLDAGQYYAHPRNAFWFIVCRLFDAPEGLGYAERAALLQRHRIALWDVLAACERPGSLDSAIRDDSLEPNDFAGFFAAHRQIRAVLFNGARAERDYRRRVLPGVASLNLRYRRLPSTSPAMASLNREQKLAQWRVLRELAASP